MIRRLLPLGLAAVLMACGGASGDGGASDDTAAPATEAPAPAATAATTTAPAGGAPAADVPEALQFSASLVGGGDIELTTLAGRPVLLWFWAPW